ncbi:MAG: HAD family hydrolase, partial [Candidatus Binatia bacterium]
VPGAQAVLATLAAHSIRIGIISNTGDLTRDQLLAMLPPDFDLARFDSDLVLLSSELDVEKPDPQIFALAVQRAQTAAHAIAFCTESLVDAVAAQRAGLLGLRLASPPHSDIAGVPALLTFSA